MSVISEKPYATHGMVVTFVGSDDIRREFSFLKANTKEFQASIRTWWDGEEATPAETFLSFRKEETFREFLYHAVGFLNDIDRWEIDHEEV